jgi:hypothetical protein
MEDKQYYEGIIEALNRIINSAPKECGKRNSKKVCRFY